MKRLHLIYTGGTFGMLTKGDAAVSACSLPEVCRFIADWRVEWFSGDAKPSQAVVDVGQVKLDSMNCWVTLGATQEPIDSSSMNLAHWQEIFGCIDSRYQDYDGFVIIHGTDTLAYTASALSFACAGLSKPIVLTGAQVPIDQENSDARKNLDNAIEVALHEEIKEVVIAFGSSVVRGCRAVKSSTVSYDAFVSPNYPAIASLNPFRINEKSIKSLAVVQRGVFSMESLEEGVELCWLHPGMHVPSCVRNLQQSSAKAVVIACFGDAHIPEDNDLIEALRKMSNAGVVLVAVSQCLHHHNTGVRYAAGELNKKAGVIDGGDATFEATLTKLMWALANCSSTKEMREVMADSIRGERSL